MGGARERLENNYLRDVDIAWRFDWVCKYAALLEEHLPDVHRAMCVAKADAAIEAEQNLAVAPPTPTHSLIKRSEG